MDSYAVLLIRELHRMVEGLLGSFCDPSIKYITREMVLLGLQLGRPVRSDEIFLSGRVGRFTNVVGPTRPSYPFFNFYQTLCLLSVIETILKVL